VGNTCRKYKGQTGTYEKRIDENGKYGCRMENGATVQFPGCVLRPKLLQLAPVSMMASPDVIEKAAVERQVQDPPLLVLKIGDKVKVNRGGNKLSGTVMEHNAWGLGPAKCVNDKGQYRIKLPGGSLHWISPQDLEKKSGCCTIC